MNTSSEAIRLLQDAIKSTKEAERVVKNLIADHDYQDVAALVTQAAAALLESAEQLMKSDDEAGLDALEAADDLLDSIWSIIDGEVDDE